MKKHIAIAKLILVSAITVFLVIFASGCNKKSSDSPSDIEAARMPIRNIEKVLNEREKSIDRIVGALLPNFLSESYTSTFKILKNSNDVADLYKDFGNYIETMYEDIDADCRGNTWKVTFDISGQKKIDGKEYEKYAEKYSRLYNDRFKDICKKYEEYSALDYEYLADDLGIKEADAKMFCDILLAALKQFEDPKVTDGYIITGKMLVTDENGKTIPGMETDLIDICVIKLNGSWMIDFGSMPADVYELPVFGELYRYLTCDTLPDLVDYYLPLYLLIPGVFN